MSPLPSHLPFNIYHGGAAKVFHLKSRPLLPCDLVYIKVFKCASSTTGGVIRRIAAHNAMSGVSDTSWVNPEPGIWANHDELSQLWRKVVALKQRVFLFTMIRLPATRCLSSYYHLEES